MKKLLTFSILFFTVAVYSQITLKLRDTISNKPASYVMVLNKNKEIIGTSNELGEIFLENNSEFKNKLLIESIFYKKKEILLNKIKGSQTIMLEPLVNLLDEVEIVNKKKYLVLTAYYRVYNLRDNVLVSFIDAKVKYIMIKNSFKKKIISFRVFEKYSKYKKFKPFWIDDLKKTSLFETLNSKFHLIKNKEKGVINIVDKKNSVIYGTISTDVRNENTKSNIVINIANESDDIIGIAREEYYNEELLKTTVKDLKYWSRINIRAVTPKSIKMDSTLKGVKKMTNVRELFIQNIDFLSKEDYKRIIKMDYKENSSSQNAKEFWEKFENFTPLDPLIEKQLNDILVQRK